MVEAAHANYGEHDLKRQHGRKCSSATRQMLLHSLSAGFAAIPPHYIFTQHVLLGSLRGCHRGLERIVAFFH